MKIRQYMSVGLLIVLLASLFFLIPAFDTGAGQGDFRAYWSASYLLAHGENMYDGGLMLRTQRAYAGVTLDTPLITLSPPWSVLIFIPLTLLPFAKAAWTWELINTLLLGVSAILLWQNSAGKSAASKYIWIPLLAAYAFSINLTAIADGQTTVFGLAMIVAFLTFEESRHDLLAGIAIAAALVKPQMVFITLVVIALYILQTRRWRMAVGFGGTIAATALILWVIRPPWLQEYLASATTMSPFAWESSNLGGILFLLTGWTGVRFLSIIAIPLVVLAWKRRGREQNFRIFIDVSLLLALITAPYGFSYDQTSLLAPILTVLAMIPAGIFRTWEWLAIVGVLVVADVYSYYQRMNTSSEVYFFWVPLLVGAIYVYSTVRANQKSRLVARSDAGMKA